MSGNYTSTYTYAHLTSSGKVKAASGVLGGFIAASQSSGTITVYDGQDNTGKVILNTMNLTSGQPVPLPVEFANGLYIVLGGTADITVWYS